MTKLRHQQPTTILITGANAGLGKECARQLSMMDGVKKIILGCRNMNKAMEAKADLEKHYSATRPGKQEKDLFDVLILDVTDLNSIERAVDSVDDYALDGLVLNAGGFGNPQQANQLHDKLGVLNIVALNVLGHVHLVNTLLKQKKLATRIGDDKAGAAATTTTTTIIYAGSRSAARGQPKFNIPKPEIQNGSVEEFISYCEGTAPFYEKHNDFASCYCGTKLLGALWMSSMARRHENDSIRFVTICPGMTAGTNQLNGFPFYQRWFYKMMIQFFQLTGKAQSIEQGAKRYVNALFDIDQTYESGIFYARNDVGKMVDQDCNHEILKNEIAQDNCHRAIHTFL